MSTESYPINSSPFYKLRSKKRLADLLKTDLSELKALLKKDNYNVFTHSENGKERIIEEPIYQLRRVQDIIHYHLSRIETPGWLASGTKGKSYIDNAYEHKDNKCFLKADIDSFYKNCSHLYVFKFFHNTLRMESDVASLLTDIVTYKGFIPTGAPTSQKIAFWAYHETFKKIVDIGQKYNAKMSLYVDDFSFSSNHPISRKLIFEMNGELKKVGLHIKNRKTKRYSTYEFKVITGVAITPDNKLRVANKSRKKIIDLVKQLDRDNTSVKLIEKLLGSITAARRIEKNIFENTFNRIKRKLEKC